MSEEFVNLLGELFPSIEEGTKEQLKAFIKQYQDNKALLWNKKREKTLSRGYYFRSSIFIHRREWKGKTGHAKWNGYFTYMRYRKQ